MTSYVHLIIDFQDEFTEGMPEHLIRSRAKRIRNFSDKLYNIHSIPTIVVALGRDFKFEFIADTLSTPSLLNAANRKRAIKHYGLEKIKPRARDPLVLKGHADAFYKSPLGNILKHNHFNGIILSGMDSSECIPSTVRGAIQAGFRCIVADDLLLESIEEEIIRQPPSWHRQIVVQNMSAFELSKTILTNSRGFLSRESCARKLRRAKITGYNSNRALP